MKMRSDHIITRQNQLVSKIESAIGDYKRAREVLATALASIDNVIDQLEDIGEFHMFIISPQQHAVAVRGTLTYICTNSNTDKWIPKWRIDGEFTNSTCHNVESYYVDITDVYDTEEDANNEIQRRLYVESIKINNRIKELSLALKDRGN